MRGTKQKLHENWCRRSCTRAVAGEKLHDSDYMTVTAGQDQFENGCMTVTAWERLHDRTSLRVATWQWPYDGSCIKGDCTTAPTWQQLHKHDCMRTTAWQQLYERGHPPGLKQFTGAERCNFVKCKQLCRSALAARDGKAGEPTFLSAAMLLLHVGWVCLISD